MNFFTRTLSMSFRWSMRSTSSSNSRGNIFLHKHPTFIAGNLNARASSSTSTKEALKKEALILVPKDNVEFVICLNHEDSSQAHDPYLVSQGYFDPEQFFLITGRKNRDCYEAVLTETKSANFMHHYRNYNAQYYPNRDFTIAFSKLVINYYC